MPRTTTSSPPEIERAAALIRAGGLVAFPTETVYGLGANALDPVAVERIYAAKGRPPESPLIVHAADTAMARSLALEWPEQAEAWAARYWPGPLTMVVKKAPHVPDRVTAGLPTVALRVPAHPVALALIRAAGVPLAAPSANRFSQLSPTAADHVAEGLADLVLDGGPADVGIESTVVSLAGPVPLLLRPGMVRLDGLLADGAEPATGAHPSPGMHARHYAPRTPLYLDAWPEDGRGFRLQLPADPAQAARELYSTLHRLDSEGYDWIAVGSPPATAEWAAVRDRLRRAAAGPSQTRPAGSEASE
jgi:L-threonylcarbamoyladenylate synthase